MTIKVNEKIIEAIETKKKNTGNKKVQTKRP